MKRRIASAAFLSTLLALGVFGIVNLAVAQNGTNVGGTINADTTWTKEGSPYNFTIPVSVNKGVTLTIEPGVTIKINEFYLEVNGTIKAIGSNEQNIVFTCLYRELAPYPYRTHYAAFNIILTETSTKNIFENSVFNATAYSPYIHFIAVTANCSSLTINNNTLLHGKFQTYGPSTITNNNFKGGGGILVRHTYSLIAYNNVEGSIAADGGSVVVVNNTVTGPVFSHPYGIWVSNSATAIISDNYVSDFDESCISIKDANATIERNIIQNNISKAQYHYGFGIQVASASPVIQNNTITECQLGILIYNNIYAYEPKEAKPTIINNNIYSNRDFNIYLGYPDGFDYTNSTQSTATNVSASLNWWGTTDPAAINQTIYDFKNLPNLGTVAFNPYLAAPNPQALPDPNSPIPTPLPLPTSSPTPSIEDHDPTPISLLLGIVAVMIVAVAASLAIYFKKHKGNKEKD